MSDLTDELHVHYLSVTVAYQTDCAHQTEYDFGQGLTLMLALSLS